jgi:hypothetical protein
VRIPADGQGRIAYGARQRDTEPSAEVLLTAGHGAGPPSPTDGASGRVCCCAELLQQA